jgi:hypothetical protein
MAITVEDGTGLAAADSYLSVADADTYHTKHGASTDWSGASTATKEEALRIATQYLDVVYSRRWIGVRQVETQSLAWPRWQVVDYDGFTIGDDEVPSQLEDATAELAVRHITETGGLLPDIASPGTIQSERTGIGRGAVTTSKTFVGGKSQIKQFRKVELLLRDLLVASSGEIARA